MQSEPEVANRPGRIDILVDGAGSADPLQASMDALILLYGVQKMAEGTEDLIDLARKRTRELHRWCVKVATEYLHENADRVVSDEELREEVRKRARVQFPAEDWVSIAYYIFLEYTDCIPREGPGKQGEERAADLQFLAGLDQLLASTRDYLACTRTDEGCGTWARRPLSSRGGCNFLAGFTGVTDGWPNTTLT